jgi:hypothetical protein
MSYYKKGCWNALCDLCGFKFKSDELRQNWKGQMVCSSDYEMRHPQDFIRVPRDDPSTPWARPEPADVFIIIGDFFQTEGGDGLFTEDSAYLETET